MVRHFLHLSFYLTAESAEGAEFSRGNFSAFSAPPRFNQFCESISTNGMNFLESIS